MPLTCFFFVFFFGVCKSAPIHADLTVSLNPPGDEVSVLVQLKQSWHQTIGRSPPMHLARVAE